MKMNFGKWIVVAFVLFAAFIATLVTVCVREDIPLVTKDYYQEELRYQQQYDRAQNTLALDNAPEITVKDRKLHLSYSQLSGIDKGELKLFRPSNAKLDQNFEVRPSKETSQYFDIDNPQPGLYRARLTWSQEGREYFIEKIVVI